MNLCVYEGRQTLLALLVTDNGWPARKRSRCFVLTARRGLAAALAQAWIFLETSLCELYGRACWMEFSHCYRDAFFNLHPGLRFYVRYRYDTPNREVLHWPRASLAPYLPDFMVPLSPPEQRTERDLVPMDSDEQHQSN